MVKSSLSCRRASEPPRAARRRLQRVEGKAAWRWWEVSSLAIDGPGVQPSLHAGHGIAPVIPGSSWREPALWGEGRRFEAGDTLPATIQFLHRTARRSFTGERQAVRR